LLDDTEEVTVEDATSTQISFDSDGKHSLTYWAVDSAANSEVPKTKTFALDTHAPLSLAPATGTYQPGTFTLSATDPTQYAFDGEASGLGAIYYRVNNGATTLYTTPLSLTANGNYLVSYWAVDRAGNSEAPRVVSYTIRRQVAAHTLSLNKQTATLLVGESIKLLTTFVPTQAERDIAWTSSNAKIASVSRDGIVRAHQAGKATIIATATYGGAKDSFVLNVENKVTSIAASHKTLTITAGKTVKLPIVAYAKDNSPVTLTWKTTKYGAATIINTTGKGAYAARGSITGKANATVTLKVKANKSGKTTITVTSRNGQRYSLRVNVVKAAKKKAVKKLNIAGLPKLKRLEAKQSKRLSVKITPKAATNVIAKWKSSRPKVIKVDASGKITALKAGKATISVKVGKKTVKVKIVAVKWKKS
jgi:uncharacterized protein YjdB